MTLELEAEPYIIEPLTKDAAELVVSGEELAKDTFRRHLADTIKENEELLRRLAMEYVLVKNAELYRRLAKSDTKNV